MRRNFLSICLVICLLASLFSGLTLGVGAAEGALPEIMWIAPSAANNVPSKINLCTPFVASTSGGGGIWGGGWGGWGGWGGGHTPTPAEEDPSGYQLYLPGNANSDACFLSWEGGLRASDGEHTFESGQLPIPAPGETKTYTFTLGEETRKFEITSYQGSEAVKPIFIEIDESLGTIKDMNSDRNHEATCTGIIYIDGEKMNLPKMKGRGNYSWTNAVQKHPYNITLDEKVNILGIDSKKTKKWSLLANVNDHTLLRNKVAYELAYDMGIGFDSASADLWMNGEYQGTYLVTPKTDSFISDDGFLIENDNYRQDPIEAGGDPSFTVSGKKESATTYATNGLLTTVKKIGKNLLEGGEETPETLTAASQVIREYLQEAWDAVGAKDGYNSQGKYYTDYFDLNKTACFYLFQEFVKNLEVDGGSIFFHRDGTAEDDKLLAGPAWDYDNALGFNGSSFGGGDRLSCSGWFFAGTTSTTPGGFYGTGGNLFTSLRRHEDLQEAARQMYNIYHTSFERVGKNVAELADEIEDSAEMNFARVTKETMNAYNFTSEKTRDAGTKYEVTYKVTDTWRDYIDNLITYTSMRAQFLSDSLLDETLQGGYKASFACAKGSSVTVYDTQDAAAEGTQNAAIAYARNSETGEIDLTGDGQINFRVITPENARIANVIVAPSENYKNLKEIEPGLYRVTKVTGDLTITVVTESNICEHEFVDGECILCGKKAYRIDFNCDDHCSVTVYDTQVLENGTEKAAFAYAKSSETGKIDISGDGQASFVVVPKPGYEVASVTAEPANFKNLKTPADTMSPNYYRITKITGDITVSVSVEKTTCDHIYVPVVTAPTCSAKGYTTYTCSRCGDSYKADETAEVPHEFVDGACIYCRGKLFAVNFLAEHAIVTVYESQAADSASAVNPNVVYARNGDTGDWDISGDGQVNFTVQPEDGYAIVSVTAAPTKSYKNLKLPEETGIGYRVTKVVGDLTITVATEKTICEHTYVSVVTAPTCTTKGYTTYTCSKCGSSYVDNETAALDHDVKETRLEATCTADGSATKECTRCDYKEVTAIPASGHDYQNGKCTRCDAEDPNYVCDGGVNCPAKAFTDLPAPGTWQHEGIDYCVENNIMNGMSDDVFAPDKTLTRGQLVTILYRVAGSPEVTFEKRFSDVNSGRYYSSPVIWAAQNNIVNGFEDGTFRPDTPITREQVAAILYRYDGSPSVIGSLTGFPDYSAVHNYGKNPLLWATQNGFLPGVTEEVAERLASQSNASRAQIASFIMRYLKSK